MNTYDAIIQSTTMTKYKLLFIALAATCLLIIALIPRAGDTKPVADANTASEITPSDQDSEADQTNISPNIASTDQSEKTTQQTTATDTLGELIVTQSVALNNVIANRLTWPDPEVTLEIKMENEIKSLVTHRVIRALFESYQIPPELQGLVYEADFDISDLSRPNVSSEQWYKISHPVPCYRCLEVTLNLSEPKRNGQPWDEASKVVLTCPLTISLAKSEQDD